MKTLNFYEDYEINRLDVLEDLTIVRNVGAIPTPVFRQTGLECRALHLHLKSLLHHRIYFLNI